MRQKGLKITGAPSLEELHNAKEYQLPEAGRPIPLAVIECIEGTPWNPFETACPQHAITVGEEITVLPVVDMELCNGCGICVAACPGLAIYLKQRTYAEGLSYIAFPYEYVPLPEKGQEVEMVDRYGSPDCAGAVIRIITSRKNDRTAVIHACYPEEYFETVVNMKRLG
jgi:Fe-S-cluster-containing hydrogenase component 2